MFVLEVIPFSRTAPTAPLSYRSRTDLPAGTLVSIPLRKKIVLGLVISSIPVLEAKSALKTASFSLSKSSDLVQGQLPKVLIEAAKNIATYHATSVGAVLSSLLIPVLPDNSTEIFADMEWQKLHTSKSINFAPAKVERVEAQLIERNEMYKKLVCSGVTLFVVPTQTEADEWAILLKSFKPIVLSGRVTGEPRAAALARAFTETSSTNSPSSQLIIATPGFEWIPLPSLDRIIIERISAGSYSLPKRPYIDIRFALTELARARNIPIIYGDFPLPLEYRKNPEEKLSYVSENTIQIIDTRTDKTKAEKSPTAWQAVPEALREQIKKTIDAQGRVAVLTARRGYSPTVVCRDCGTAVTDEHGRILSLATINGNRVFRSSDGKVSQSAEVFCKVCGGWNLQPLGIGIERVEEELRAAFPNTPIVRIDQDTKTSVSLKKARAEITQPGTIILGTEIMLPFLSPYEPVELGIIASADSLLALPFWRARERFIRIGYMLRERSKHTLIATRHSNDTALSILADVSDTSFWNEEVNLRKTLSYPPFGTLIIFHIEGTEARLEEARLAIRSACLPYIPYELPNKAAAGTSHVRSSLVLQLPQNIWPDTELSRRLAALSPSIRLAIDSEMLW